MESISADAFVKFLGFDDLEFGAVDKDPAVLPAGVRARDPEFDESACARTSGRSGCEFVGHHVDITGRAVHAAELARHGKTSDNGQ